MRSKLSNMQFFLSFILSFMRGRLLSVRNGMFEMQIDLLDLHKFPILFYMPRWIFSQFANLTMLILSN